MPVPAIISKLTLLGLSILQQSAMVSNPYAPGSISNTVWLMLHPSSDAGEWCGSLRMPLPPVAIRQ